MMLTVHEGLRFRLDDAQQHLRNFKLKEEVTPVREGGRGGGRRSKAEAPPVLMAYNAFDQSGQQPRLAKIQQYCASLLNLPDARTQQAGPGP